MACDTHGHHCFTTSPADTAARPLRPMSCTLTITPLYSCPAHPASLSKAAMAACLLPPTPTSPPRLRCRPTWVNMDNGLNTIEFYAGDISGNFATDAAPHAVGGAQDNGPSSVTFAGTPTGPDPVADGTWRRRLLGPDRPDRAPANTRRRGTISLTTGGAVAGDTFTIGTQTFTFVAAVRLRAR